MFSKVDDLELQVNQSSKSPTVSTIQERTIANEPHEKEIETQNEKTEDHGQPTAIEYPDGGLRAWSLVFGAACIYFSSFGFVNSYGVFQAYYQQTLLPDSSPSSIAWIGSLQYALVFVPALPTGRLLDLGHFNIPLAISSAAFIVSVFLTAECKTYWQLLLCQGLAVGLSAGFIFGPVPGCVAHWFHKRRTLAFGLVAAGSSIGGTVLPIATRRLLNQVGYPWTLRILGFILLVTVTTGNLLLRRRLPPRNVRGGLFNWAALKNPAFTLWVIACNVTFLGLYAQLNYLDISAQNVGISPDISFYFISIANGGSLIGRVAGGVFADKYGGMNVLIPFTLLAAVMTYAWPWATTPGALVVVALIYGAGSGAFVSLLPTPSSRMGGMEDVGRRIGLVTTLSAIGAVTGPPIAGVIRTNSGGFHDVGAYAGSAIVAGCMIMMASRRLVLGSWKGIF